MRMTDGDLWHKCASCVKVYSDDFDPVYDEILAGLEDWFFETRGNELPTEWGARTETKGWEYDNLCLEMKKMYLILAVDTVYYGSWTPEAIEALALGLMKALEAYFGKEYC